MIVWNVMTMGKSGKLVHPATISRAAIADLVPRTPAFQIGIRDRRGPVKCN